MTQADARGQRCSCSKASPSHCAFLIQGPELRTVTWFKRAISWGRWIPMVEGVPASSRKSSLSCIVLDCFYSTTQKAKTIWRSKQTEHPRRQAVRSQHPARRARAPAERLSSGHDVMFYVDALTRSPCAKANHLSSSSSSLPRIRSVDATASPLLVSRSSDLPRPASFCL